MLISKDISCILFDLDGTLIDSMWVWEQIDIAFMKERNLIAPQNLQQNIAGLSFAETASYFIRTFSLSETEEELMQIWNDTAVSYYQNKVPAKDGALEFLEQAKAYGLTTGIGTSNSRHLTEIVLHAHGMDRYIDRIVTCEDVANSKPAPDVYLAHLKDSDLSPSQCLVFEDIPEGIAAAKAAGMKCCAVYDEYARIWKDDLSREANGYIYTFDELVWEPR